MKISIDRSNSVTYNGYKVNNYRNKITVLAGHRKER